MGRPDIRPLSVGQQSLWLLHAATPDSPAYNDAAAVTVDPPPDAAALAAAVTALLRRHDLLRSRFVADPAEGAVRVVDAVEAVDAAGAADAVDAVDAVGAAGVLRSVELPAGADLAAAA
ncbi:MAG TPA: condensation domain-containing protein, partial [Pseudonocardiaceae bacterium]